MIINQNTRPQITLRASTDVIELDAILGNSHENLMVNGLHHVSNGIYRALLSIEFYTVIAPVIQYYATLSISIP